MTLTRAIQLHCQWEINRGPGTQSSTFHVSPLAEFIGSSSGGGGGTNYIFHINMCRQNAPLFDYFSLAGHLKKWPFTLNMPYKLSTNNRYM